MTRSALATALALLIHAPAPRPASAQEALLQDVRSRFLPEALRTLEEAGFGNIRVARQIMDDMPSDVVIWQHPLPPRPAAALVAPAPAARRLIDPATEITLIVVEGLPVIPDLTGWRVDHAVEHVAALGVEARLRGSAGDPARSVVVGQEPPGPARILPPAAVALEAGPMPRDTVLLTMTDTVVEARVDTVRAAEEGGGVPVYLVALASVAGLALGGLGGLGVHRLSGGTRRPRPPAATTPPATPQAPRDAEPPGHRREGLSLDAFEPLLVDEAIRVTAGRVEAGAGPGAAGEPGGPGGPGGPGEEWVP